MVLEELVASLEEYIQTKSDKSATDKMLQEAKRAFAKSLNNYIDWRAEGVLNGELKRISTNQSEAVANLLHHGKIDAIVALNSCPQPPSDGANIKEWVENYNQWYFGDRKKGLG